VRSAKSATLHNASARCFFASAEEVLAFSAVLLSSWRCSAAAAAAAAAAAGAGCYYCLLLSIDDPHIIQDRLQDCLIRCALCYPKSWINVQEVLPDAGCTSNKDMLEVLTLHLVVLVFPVFQHNDCDMIPFPPLFSWYFECTYTCKNRVLIGSWGCSWRPTGLPLPPQPLLSKMTPGRPHHWTPPNLAIKEK